MNIANHFFQMALREPQSPAIVDARSTVTFGQLAAEVQGIMGGLKKIGVKKGDSVMVMIPFSVELYKHILAVFALGARVVLVDTLRPKTRVAYAYEKAECKVLITVPWLRRLHYFLFPKSVWHGIRVVRPMNGPMDCVAMQEEDTALITFTSGTTGDPKAADRTHGFLSVQLNTLKEELHLEHGKSHLTSLPVVLMCNLAFGVASIIPPSYRKKKAWKKIFLGRQLDILSGSPHHINKFVDRVELGTGTQIFVGGATILPHFVENLKRKIPLNRVHFVYGSTEAEPMALLSGVDYFKYNENTLGICVGQTHDKIELKINERNSARLQPVQDGEVGEILVSGPHVLSAYFKDETSFKKHKIVEGETLWHRTGDAGYLREGRLYYLGRMKHVAILGDGRLFSPTLIEKAYSFEFGIHATQLYIDGRMVLFIERKNKALQLKENLFPADKVISIKAFKFDKRHQSRLDYQHLKSIYLKKS